MTMTFTSQSEIWIERLRTRKRNPLKESSLAVYRSYLRKILPLIGKTKLAEFGPLEMRAFVSELALTLGPKATNEIVSVTKQILASATDEQGQPLFPRTFNSEFIDLPIVDPRQQKTPMVTREELEHTIESEPSEVFRCLYACLAGAGLRINECLSIKFDAPDSPHTVFDAKSSMIHVRRGLWRRREQDSPKTPSSVRSVEVPFALGEMLARFAGNREGFLFGNGTPLSESTARDHLDARLPRKGFHAIRRFFISHRRANGMPEEILRTLVGHSSSNMTDRYSRFGTDAGYAAQRREWVERVGLGFQLPLSREA
jgi:integrase